MSQVEGWDEPVNCLVAKQLRVQYGQSAVNGDGTVDPDKPMEVFILLRHEKIDSPVIFAFSDNEQLSTFINELAAARTVVFGE